VVTPYASTGFTEQQLIKQQQDIAYDDYKKAKQEEEGAYQLVLNMSGRFVDEYSDKLK